MLSSFVLALPIFPGRLQPSIVGRSELNFRVRDGNGWTLTLISTNYSIYLKQLSLSNSWYTFSRSVVKAAGGRFHSFESLPRGRAVRR